MKLTAINAGNFKLDGGAMHGVVPKSMWQKYNPSDELNMCSWAMRCLLIEVENRKILIDCGMGNKQDEKFFSRYYLHGQDSIENQLAMHQLSTDDITDVFLTHLHFDHVGGAIVRDGHDFAPRFKNATYWSDKIHWKTATKPNAREKASFLPENILPLKDLEVLKFIDTHDGGEWDLGINIKFVNGHTEGMMLPIIPYKNTYLLFCADLIPSVAHISLPWVMAYDMRPVDTLNEKEEMLAKAADHHWILFFEHDPKNQCATVKRTDKGIVVDSIFNLADIDQHL